MTDEPEGEEPWTAKISSLETSLAEARAELASLRQSGADRDDLAKAKADVATLAGELRDVRATLATLARPLIPPPSAPQPNPVDDPPNPPAPAPRPAPRSRHDWL